jgi:hypothetical protein
MQIAKAIRWGGMPVDATECDYSTFLNDGLLCPICNGTVFLVSSSTRESHKRKLKNGDTREVKQAQIPAHFSHHKADKIRNEECELRAAKITPVQRQQMYAQARGQVANKFRHKFWGMVKTSVKVSPDDFGDALLTVLLRASSLGDMRTKSLLRLLVQTLSIQFAKPVQLAHTKDTIEPAIAGWAKQAEDLDKVPLAYRDAFRSWSNQLDMRMQVMIVSEALDYISTKAQRPILEELVMIGIYNWILANAGAKFYSKRTKLSVFNDIVLTESEDQEFSKLTIAAARELVGMDNNQLELLFSFVRDDIGQILTFVDWPNQFAKSEK